MLFLKFLPINEWSMVRMNRRVKTMNSKHGLYTYGIVGKSPEQLDILGIDKKSKVYPVEGRGICVMVSEIDVVAFQDQVKHLLSELTKTAPEILRCTQDDSCTQAAAQSGTILQAHEDVVDTLMKGTTVVPFKFGTILKDEKDASKLLQDDEEQFKKLLSKFSGRA